MHSSVLEEKAADFEMTPAHGIFQPIGPDQPALLPAPQERREERSRMGVMLIQFALKAAPG